MTGASTEALKVRVLERVSCIYYLVQFHKDKNRDVLALLNSRSEVNAMTSTYAAHLGLKIRIIDVGARKTNASSLATYGMVIAAFQVVDKFGRSWFFQETFLPANISMKVVLGMSLLTFSNADI